MVNFRNLEVWRRAHALTLQIYKVTATFPKSETYGLSSQMRRSSAAIPTNIAEGCGRGGKAELANFLQIARGSASELEYQVVLAQDLGLVEDSEAAELVGKINEIQRMLVSYRRRVVASKAEGWQPARITGA